MKIYLYVLDTPIVDNTSIKQEFEIPELIVETSPEHI